MSSTRRSPALRAGLSGLVLVAALAAVASDQRPAPDATGGVYAVATGHGLRLMRGAVTVATVSAELFGESPSLGFTEDGRFAYVNSYNPGDTGASTVVSIDTRTGAGTTTRCGCAAVAAAGAGTVAWFDEHGDLFEADLSARPVAPHRRPVVLPAPEVDSYPYTVIGGADGVLLAATRAAPPQRPELLVVNAAGQVGRLRNPPPGFQESPTAAWSGTGGPGPTVALVVANRDTDPCGTPVGVELIDPHSGRVTHTAVTGERPGTAAVRRVDDLWWGAEATLYASISTIPCGKDGDRPMQRNVWRLAGGAWHQLQPSVVIDARQVDASTTIAVLSTDPKAVQVAPAGSVIRLNGPILAIRTPTPRVRNGAMSLRLGASPCSNGALAARPPRFLTSAVVSVYDCRDGYAYAQYSASVGGATVTRGELLAAVGGGWQAIATGTVWDGRLAPQDLRYAGLDATSFLALFPQAAEPDPTFSPDMSGLVGTWDQATDGGGAGRLVVAGNTDAWLTYRSRNGPEHHVALEFVRTTRNSAIAFASSSDDPQVPIGAEFRMAINGSSFWLTKPFAYQEHFKKVG